MARDETELLEMGARITELRAAHGFKQQWIADQIGVSLRAYQFWQAGASPPEQESLEKLAKLFGVTPKYILKGETPDLHDETQLDRIETKLDRLLAVIEPLDVDQLMALLQRAAAQIEPPADEEHPGRAA